MGRTPGAPAGPTLDPAPDASPPRTRAEARTRSREVRAARRHPRVARPAHARPRCDTRPRRVPRAPALVMSAAGFLVLTSQAVPVALMAPLGEAIHRSAGQVGTLVTAHALGALLVGVPATLYTGVDSRRQVLTTLVLLTAATLVGALTGSWSTSLVARFVAGGCSGLLWVALTWYAHRQPSRERVEHAEFSALLGMPVALLVGVPGLGVIGQYLGWRAAGLTFAAVSALVTLVAAGALPTAPRRPVGLGSDVLRVARLPGLGPVLAVTALFSTAHHIEYIYLATLTRHTDRLPVLQAAIGVGALVGAYAGLRLVSRRPWRLTQVALAALTVALPAQGLLRSVSPAWSILVVTAWGLALGGASGSVRVASAYVPRADQVVAVALVVVAWQAGVTASAVGGGLLVDHGMANDLPLVGACIAALGMTTAVVADPPRAAVP